MVRGFPDIISQADHLQLSTVQGLINTSILEELLRTIDLHFGTLRKRISVLAVGDQGREWEEKKRMVRLRPGLIVGPLPDEERAMNETRCHERPLTIHLPS